MNSANLTKACALYNSWSSDRSYNEETELITLEKFGICRFYVLSGCQRCQNVEFQAMIKLAKLAASAASLGRPLFGKL